MLFMMLCCCCAYDVGDGCATVYDYVQHTVVDDATAQLELERRIAQTHTDVRRTTVNGYDDMIEQRRY